MAKQDVQLLGNGPSVVDTQLLYHLLLSIVDRAFTGRLDFYFGFWFVSRRPRCVSLTIRRALCRRAHPLFWREQKDSTVAA